MHVCRKYLVKPSLWYYYYSAGRHRVKCTKHHRRLVGSQASISSNNIQFASPPTKLSSSCRTRILFGSCSDPTEDLSYWNTMREMKPDMILLLGDNVYADKNENECLASAYKRMGNDVGFQQTAQDVPILATLDDNDSGNNNKDQAKELFLNFFQIPKSDPRWKPGRGVYTSYNLVDQNDECVLQMILLDVRYSSDSFLQTPNWGAAGMERYVPDFDIEKTLLGHEQWDWLQQQLTRVKPKLRILASPIQVLAQGHGWECWRMFPHEREKLLSLLLGDDTTTLLLSGDRHTAGFYLDQALFEITSSSLTHSVPPGLLSHEVDETRMGDLVCTNNFGMLDIDWKNNDIVASIRDTREGDKELARQVIEMNH